MFKPLLVNLLECFKTIFDTTVVSGILGLALSINIQRAMGGARMKTLADCFKLRNKIGLDTAVDAVRFYRERKSVNVDDLIRYAAICRVEKVIRPYLEAIL